MSRPTRILRIGIASRDQVRDRMRAVARGELRPKPDDPKIWFTSIESLAQVLSTRNRELLEIIRRTNPASLQDLAARSGRRVSNLSRTLRTMERYGLIRLDRRGARIAPKVGFDRISLDVRLDGGPATPSRRRIRTGRELVDA